MPTVNIIGVGYIGTVISCYFAEKEYKVNGIDKNSDVRDKESWFKRFSDIERNLNEDNLDLVNTSTSYKDIDKDSVSIICVDTPTDKNGELDLSNLKDSIKSLSKEINKKHTIIVRSTILPGTSKNIIIPLIEETSGMKVGEDIYYGYAPEFVRGGSGMEDLKNPSKQIVAGNEKAIESFISLFPSEKNTFRPSLETAEALKYVDNAFHGLKISIANEVGRLGDEIGFDGKKVMEIIVSDQKLNISEKYLDPGSSFGGPCLRKDISALNREIEDSKTQTPVISSIIASNNSHNSWIISKINRRDNIENIGLVGATYKESFNSIIDSPCINIGEQLENQGYNIRIHDPLLEDSLIENVSKSEIKKSDILIIFNDIPNLKEIKKDFKGEILDLSEFNV